MRKLFFLILMAAFIMTAYFLPAGNLAVLQHYQATFTHWHHQHSILIPTLFFIIYVGITTLSIPGATLLTLLAGSQFGLLQGLMLVTLAASCGATLSMLISRYLLRRQVQHRFTKRMESINRGMEKQGSLYLFALRLTPIVPFFLVNILMGLTTITTGRYFIISLLGMLPATSIYLNAGRQLSKLHSLSDIVSPPIMLMLALVGLLPLASRWLVNIFRITQP